MKRSEELIKTFNKLIVAAFFLLPPSLGWAQQWKIMPVGNSITAGKDGNSGIEGNGFRKYLYDDLRAGGVDFVFAGDRGNSPYNGHFQSAAKIEWFNPGGSMDLPRALDIHQPNIILLHLGTNNAGDTPGPYTQPGTSSYKLRELINSHIAKNANVKYILLCKILPKLDDNFQEMAAVKQFNKEIETMFFSNALSAKVVLVDMYSALSPTRNDLPDGIHPVDAGYRKMSDEYARVLKAVIRSDTAAPSPVDVISSTVTGEPAIKLEWYTPRDNGGGIVNLYELRYKVDEDISDANFANGTLVYLNRPEKNGASGGKEQRSITENILAGRTYSFAIRVYDQANNRSAIRKFASVTTPYQLAQAGIAYADSFNYSDLRGWNTPSSYIVANGNLKNTDAASGWSKLAILDSIKYTPSAEYVKAGARFAPSGGGGDFRGTGIAMLLDTNEFNLANGYMIRVGDNIDLYTIVSGKVGALISSSKPTASLSRGDTLSVVYRNNPTANSFEVLKNGVSIGQVQDSDKRYGKTGVLYSGIILHGSLGNEIDSYALTIPQLQPERMIVFGDPTLYAQVDKKLGNPLSVQVVDINGIGVGNVPVDFRVQSGTAFLSADSICSNFDGYIYIEAESGVIESPMVTAMDDKAAGSRYIYSKKDRSGKAVFTIWIPCSGSYDMILRVIAPDDNANSLFWAIDDTSNINNNSMAFTDKPTSWTWATKSRVNGISLAEGFHKLYIKGREANTRVDKILLTRYSGFVPTGEGGAPLKLDNITDGRGIVSTRVSFGSQTGEVLIDAYSDAVPSPENRVQFPPITVNAGDPALFVATSSLIIQGEAGKLLPQPFQVRIEDRYGNKRRGELVIFQVHEGDGSFNGSAIEKAFTDETGIAQATLKLGFSNQTVVKAFINDFPNFPAITFTGAAESGTIPFTVERITATDRFDVPVNTPIADSLKVQVRNQRGNPYRGYPVPFAVVGGDGRLNGGAITLTDTTDAQGYAAVSWNIGRIAGIDTHRVEVKVPLNGSPVVFTATARPDKPNELQKISGDPQSQGAGKKFTEPLRVRIVDQYSNGIADFPVHFSVASGYGNFSNKLVGGSRDTTTTTDLRGYAQVFYTAGNVKGIEQVKAEGAGAQPLPLKNLVIFQPLTVTQPLPQKLAIESGNNQRKTVGLQLETFEIKVMDPFDKMMGPGYKVNFQVIQGNSSFSNEQSIQTTTDDGGIARAVMTLGTVAGVHKARVTLPDYPDVAPIEFTATADAGAAAVLKPDKPSNLLFSGVAGSGPIPLAVQVTDFFNNPKQNHSVTFTVEIGGFFQTGSGNLKTATVTTDAKGLATVNYFIGQKTAETNVVKVQSFQVGTTHLSGSPITLTGTVLAGAPVAMRKIREYNQQLQIQRTYPDSLTVELKDIYQNPVTDIEVQFIALSKHGGNISGLKQASIFTNRSGQASVLYTLGTRAAVFSDTVVVSAPGLNLNEERFLLTALPADPYKITTVGDSSWVLKLGAGSLTRTPTVKVTDAFGNAISGRQVTFTVAQGAGTIGGMQSFSTNTNSIGEASALWMLNSQSPEQHSLIASVVFNGTPLKNSPRTFSASVVSGDASKLVRVSPPTPTSDAIAKNKMPIIVAVQDAFDNGVSNNTVKFSVTFPASGDRGFFVDNGQPVYEYQTKTNAQGVAQAEFFPTSGTNIVTVGAADEQPITRLSFTINGVPAKATRIRLVNARQLELTAGGSVAVRVEAYNAEGALVDGHPVDFSINAGEGRLSNNFISNRKVTINGIAEETWTVGKDVQVINKLRISGGDGVQGSPDSITVRLKASAPFADSSRVQITAAGGSITTDDDSKAIVTVKLADNFGNPVSGYRVRLASNDTAAIFDQPKSETGTNGEAYGSVRATKVGNISVYAFLENNPDFKTRSASVTVKAGKAAKLALPSGATDRFTANIGAVAKSPLQVVVQDKYDNVVQPFSAEVQFEIKGSGEFITPTGRVPRTNIQVDSTGRAAVVYKAGSQGGLCLIEATLSDPPGTGAKVTFNGTVRTALVPYTVQRVSGDSLSLPVGAPSTQPLKVLVTDKDGLPVSGGNPAVQFTVTAGQVEFSGGPTAGSDEYGHALKYFTLKSGGKHTIKAQIFGGASETAFTAFAQAGAPTQLTAAAALTQEATVASVQNNLLKVMVMDKDGNAVDGVPVLFQKIEEPMQTNGAVVDPNPVLTGSGGVAGVATAKITLGEKAGEYVIRASSSALSGQQIDFTIHAQADAAYYLGKHAGDNQSMTRGRRLVYPVVVKVTDKFQNPVAGIAVDFAPADNVSGSVAKSSVTTDASGLAANWWTIGTAERNELYYQKLGLKPWPAGASSTFEAYGVDNRFPQFVNMRRDTTIVYGQPFTLALTARDDDGDALRYSMSVKPSTAVFDAASAKMIWTPTYNELGNWTAKFRVDDNRTPSGFAVDSVRINVISKIKIFDWSPFDSYLKIPDSGVQQFCVSVTDQNPNSVVRYTWSVNDQVQPATGSCFLMNAANFPKTFHSVKVVVNDGVSQDSHSWSIKVKVELSSFEAATVPFEGVRLDWKTTAEDGNLGFDVLRSASKNGAYEKITGELVAKQSNGVYSFTDTSAVAGRTYFYKLEDFDRSGVRTQSEELMVTVDLPKEFMLLQNYPNPFNPKTAIRFQLPKATETRIVVFNIRGQEVRALINERLEPGYHAVTWDSRNNDDLQVSSGIYYYRIHAGDFSATKKMVLIR